MSDELELISDDDGFAVVGDPEVVECFLAGAGLESTEFNLGRFSSRALGAAAGSAEVAAKAWEQSSRWVKLTPESAAMVKQFGLAPTKIKGVSHAIIRDGKGVKSWLQVDTRAAAQLANPAFVTGVAGLMSQVAMQQTMNEIVDYLEGIDEKLDAVRRAQKDAAVAPMLGTGFLVDEAMAIRDERGRVDEITWSKLHGAPAAIAETQAYALRQLDALAEQLERKSRLGEMAEAVRDARAETQEWLAVLARSFQLQDAIAVLELDRVLDAAPDELEAHRLGLKRARVARLERIADSTARILTRVEAVASTANDKVLIHPSKAPAVAQACQATSLDVARFQEAVGIQSSSEVPEARRWTEAVRQTGGKAIETGGKALATGTDGARVVKRAGGDAAARGKSASGKVVRRAQGLRRRGTR